MSRLNVEIISYAVLFDIRIMVIYQNLQNIFEDPQVITRITLFYDDDNANKVE